MSVYNLIVNATATNTAPPTGASLVVQPIQPGGGLNQPAQVVAITASVSGSGAVSATIQPIVSNDSKNWSNFGTALSLSGTNTAGGNTSSQSPFTYWSAIVTAISGTNATVNSMLSA